jgi:hypothetical protein
VIYDISGSFIVARQRNGREETFLKKKGNKKMIPPAVRT